ncbi:integrin [Nitrospira sp. BLG_1]|uniref:integrin n=1 Tax=Nitrospira sp. BLG_1 TaxID=3395883 RepID=UPI0039BD5AF3
MTFGPHLQPHPHRLWQSAALACIINASLGMAGCGNSSPLPESSLAQQAYLKASNTDPNDKFGSAVAIDGDTLVVGAQEEDSGSSGINGNQSNNSGNDIGAVYVFVRSGGIWTQQAYLKASNPDDLDTFGTSVAISGNTIVVGAQGEDSNATGVTGNQSDNSVAQAGAAYVFVRNGTTWTQQAYLKPSTAGFNNFGNTVAIDGDTIAIGAEGEDSASTGINGSEVGTGAPSSGAVYVFTRSGTTWSQQAYIKSSNSQGGDQFGNSVALSHDTLAVGAVGEDSAATGIGGNQGDNSASGSGAVYVFTRSGNTWSQQAYVKASNSAANSSFGGSLSLDNNTLAVGTDNASTAYIFTRSGGLWTQEALLQGANTENGDQFGISVAVHGDTLAVGASGEDSAATGINGDGTNNSASDSGALYVFTRSGTTWTQRDYVKASNREAGDSFGSAIAANNGTIVSGAYLEDSHATGINGIQTDNSATDSGAVYVFQ